MKKQIVVSQKHGNVWIEKHQDGSVTIRPDKTQSGEIVELKEQIEMFKTQRDNALNELHELRAKAASLFGLKV
jgi:hypothetical protein